MGDSRTLQNLLDDAAARADVIITTDSFVTQSQATTWVNQAIGRMRGRIIQEYDEDYYSKYGPNTNTSAGVDLYNLPTDFFKLLGVDFSMDGGTKFFDAHRLNMGDRNRFGSGSLPWSRLRRPRYKLFGSQVMFRPFPDSIYVFRLIYAPTLTRLSNLADPFEFYNGWDRYVGADVAKKIAVKEGSDPTPHIADKNEAYADMCNEVRVRDAAEPARVRDSMRIAADALGMYDDEDDSW